MTVNGAGNTECIEVRGASEHNLKDVDVSIPIGKLTCVTGPSGCGKSSLVYDTIYAESQRTFLESMSASMFGQKLMQAPKVSSISNLRPALDLSQGYYNFNPRSTVGTLSDVSAYLRTLFALVASHERGARYEERFFSCNNPTSWCPKCHGTGSEYVISKKAVVPDEDKRLQDGAIAYYRGSKSSMEYKTLLALCDHYGIDIGKRFSELSSSEASKLLYADDSDVLVIRYKTAKGKYRQGKVRARGAITELSEKLLDVDTPSTYASIQRFLVAATCSECGGSKLRREVSQITVCGMGISEVDSASLNEALEWAGTVDSTYSESPISGSVSQLCAQISARLNALVALKVGYLSMSRSVPSLSGGERQRVRLANQLCCSLNGLIYVLDEPCKGLHPHDLPCIIGAAQDLVQRGNTVLAIEHNKRFIGAADVEIKLGPAGGPEGGYVICAGAPPDANELPLDFKKPLKPVGKLSISGIKHNNLRDLNVTLPLGAVTAVTGVSGSGKSSLLEAVELCLSGKGNSACSCIEGAELIKRVYAVDQQPIGKTPRSTVVSYLGIYDEIRSIFAASEASQALGLSASDFSMNVEGGRCEACKGAGVIKISYQHLPDTYVECPECNGDRFTDRVLSVRYGGLGIGDVLDRPAESLGGAFSGNEKIAESLRCLNEVGLGYLRLGQPSMSLSGGEAQRIKLAKALGKKATGKDLYLLDEPTSGLESIDASRISRILTEMAARGNTVIVVEHNPSFIAETADYVIDFGCRSGKAGGSVVSFGLPRAVFGDSNSSWCELSEAMS